MESLIKKVGEEVLPGVRISAAVLTFKALRIMYCRKEKKKDPSQSFLSVVFDCQLGIVCLMSTREILGDHCCNQVG